MKRNLQKISLAKITSLAMILPTLTACGGGGTPSGTTAPSGETTSAPVEETTALTDNLPDVNLDGFECTFYIPSPDAMAYALIVLDAEETNGDLVNDGIYERNRRVEERFNCVISEARQANTHITNFVNSVQAGENTFKLAEVPDSSINKLMTAGAIADWSLLPYVDLEQPWWNQSANKNLILNGIQYSALGDFNLSEYSKCYMLYMNKDIYSTINQSKSVYDMVLDGSWTLDNFIAIAKQYGRDLNGNAAVDEADQFGYSACTKVGMQLMINGAGVNFVEIDKEGVPYYALPGNQLYIEKLQTLITKLRASEEWYNIAPKPNGGMQDELFKDGRVLFQAASIWQTETYRAIEFDIGMLPAPKLDENQEDYYTVTTGGVLTGVSRALDAEELEKVSIVLEAMAFDSRMNLLPLYKQTVLKDKYARDEESTKMIDIIFDTMVFDPGVLVWTTARTALMEGPLFTLDDTLVSSIESGKVNMEAAIQASIDAVKDLA